MAQAAGGFGGAPAAGGWQQQPAAQQAPANFAGAAGVDPCQTAVLSIIQASNAEQGVNQTEVGVRAMGGTGLVRGRWCLLCRSTLLVLVRPHAVSISGPTPVR
jgi:hypothetical protein